MGIYYDVWKIIIKLKILITDGRFQNKTPHFVDFFFLPPLQISFPKKVPSAVCRQYQITTYKNGMITNEL
jgi:hypothetical protein